ncbi:MAG: GNAT family N-acetyltransferase [Actinomycetales bacterium]|nr:GNAT family N-acetyltransferase [Actinomycetales bacterium]
MSTLEWSPLTAADLPDLVELARACLAHDGGLPLLGTEELVTGFFLVGEGIGGRDETGEIVAAAGLFDDDTGRACATGLVHPSARRQGHGEQLVTWARSHSGEHQPLVVAETMSREAESLFAANGLHRTFAESVMRHRLKHIPRVPLPDGLRTEPFREDTASAFFTAYRGSFGDRPGFPDPSEAQWLQWLASDADLRPQDCRVAFTKTGEPVGFVTVSSDWIDEVGVVPAWRGRGLGAHLVVRSLSALKRAGARQVWLCVGADNTSRCLYERLGFRYKGTRARYEKRSAVWQALDTRGELSGETPA